MHNIDAIGCQSMKLSPVSINETSNKFNQFFPIFSKSISYVTKTESKYVRCLNESLGYSEVAL